MRTVDLFSGCGGMSLGFEKAGFDLVGAFEYWPVAVDCYKENFSHPIVRMDLTETDIAIQAIQQLNPEIIIGGPPCQDFSHAGKRIEARRANLTRSFAEIVEAISPQYFIMENVDRSQKSNAFADARQLFINAGYGLTEVVLDASFCGVPQRRKRFFCIGAMGAPHDFALELIKTRISSKETTLRDYFGKTLDFEYYYRHPRNYSRRAIFSIDEPAPTMRGVNRPVPKGYPGHPNDACPLSDELHALSTLERALIQTFPPNYKWIGTKTDMEQMIGNAVPVELATFVANVLKDYIETKNQPVLDKEGLIAWLVNASGLTERSARDVASRIKRANGIHKITQNPDSYYIFQLENTDDFENLSMNVKSQVKRAVNLYERYLNSVR